jgi:uncharacterized protein YcbK (DUF882 family)
MKYFTISELTGSDTASIKKIDNTPNKEITEHLIELVEKLLDPLRSAWAEYCDVNRLGNPAISVNSGYRCNELNKAVGGSSTSAHLTGYAADISPINGNMKVFQSWIAEAIEKYDFDQLIYEKPRNGIAS